MSSQTVSASASLWVMKTTSTPRSRRRLSVVKKASVSSGVSTAVGSSSRRTFGASRTARRISTRACVPTGSVSQREAGSPMSSWCSRAAARASAMRSAGARNRRAGSGRPRRRFSATERAPIRAKCWWTTPIPLSCAARDPGGSGRPSTRIVPVSAGIAPARMVPDQGRLSGAVLAEDAVDWFRRRAPADQAQRRERAEGLADAAQLEARGRHHVTVAGRVPGGGVERTRFCACGFACGSSTQNSAVGTCSVPRRIADSVAATAARTSSGIFAASAGL